MNRKRRINMFVEMIFTGYFTYRILFKFDKYKALPHFDWEVVPYVSLPFVEA